MQGGGGKLRGAGSHLSHPQVSTAEGNGILLYNGDSDHMAVELYQGHVRVSYDPGTHPSSAIYRYRPLIPTALTPLRGHGATPWGDRGDTALPPAPRPSTTGSSTPWSW